MSGGRSRVSKEAAALALATALTCVLVCGGCERDAIEHQSGDGGVVDARVSPDRGGGARDGATPRPDTAPGDLAPDVPVSSGWSALTTGETQPLHNVFGVAGRLFAIGGQGVVLERVGAVWKTLASGSNDTLMAIWAAPGSVDDLWIAGQSMLRYQAGRFVAVTAFVKTPIQALWGSGANDIWAVGRSGVVARYDGSSWKDVTYLATSALDAVCGVSATELWAVGAGGFVARGDGTTFNAVDTKLGVTAALRGVWCGGPKDVWVVGDGGTILRYVGAWSKSASPTSDRLRAIWGSSSSDVWAVGGQGTIIRYDGQAWRKVSSPTSEDLYAVWGDSAGRVWAVGASGTALLYRP